VLNEGLGCAIPGIAVRLNRSHLSIPYGHSGRRSQNELSDTGCRSLVGSGENAVMTELRAHDAQRLAIGCEQGATISGLVGTVFLRSLRFQSCRARQRNSFGDRPGTLRRRKLNAVRRLAPLSGLERPQAR
jgi:hypothetical protein